MADALLVEIDATIAAQKAACDKLKAAYDDADILEEAQKIGRRYNKAYRELQRLKAQRLEFLGQQSA